MFGFGRVETATEDASTKSHGLFAFTKVKRHFDTNSNSIKHKRTSTLSGFVDVSLANSPASLSSEDDDARTRVSSSSSSVVSTTTTLQESFALRRTSSSISLLDQCKVKTREPSVGSIEMLLGDLSLQSWPLDEKIDRWEEAKLAVLLNENDHRVDAAALRLSFPMQHIDWSMRRMLVTWMNEVC